VTSVKRASVVDSGHTYVPERECSDEKNSINIVDTDLRDITRDSSHICTEIWLDGSYEKDNLRWLVLGDCHIRRIRDTSWLLSVYLLDVTDPEHDTVYALRLPLIGVTFLMGWRKEAGRCCLLGCNLE